MGAAVLHCLVGRDDMSCSHECPTQDIIATHGQQTSAALLNRVC